jgi:DNA-binding CsgD family transcriptional regulator
LALDLARASSGDEALSVIVHTAVHASGSDCAGLYLKDSATGDLELVSCAGLSEEFQGKASHAGVGSDEWRLLNKETPAYYDLDETMSGSLKGLLVAEGIRSVAIIPILYQGGAVACFSTRAGWADAMPASSRSTLEVIGAQAGSTIARMRVEHNLQKDLQIRKQTEAALEAKTSSLQEVNSALRTLLNGRERDKNELAEKVLSNAEQLIQPYLTKLKKSRLDVSQQTWVDIIEANLREITSPFLKNVAAFDSTPKEFEVVQLMKQGRSTKEIAELLHVCTGAIDMHRHRIRKKLGLNKKKTNLQAYLFSLAH